MSLSENTRPIDPIAGALRTYAQNILVLVFGLLPIFFVPSAIAPFEYTKIFFVLGGVLVALVLFSLSLLRTNTISVGFSLALCAMWTIVGIAFISSLLSGDFRDSLIGDIMSIHSTMFVALLALVMSVWVVIDAPKGAVMRLYMLLAASTLVLVVFHVLRLIFGADTLSFGIFTSAIATPMGSWNDLALFLGLSVILSLVALEQLVLNRAGRILFCIVTVIALFMLGVINFFTVWLVLGLTSLAMIVYSLSKDRFSATQLSFVSQKQTNVPSLTLALVVFGASVLFIIGGSALGGYISKYTDISYIEVRPSLQATADIASNVYKEDAFLGIGTNKFTDAWRLYKDEAINSTVFWNTDFNAGNGYITSFFITNGVLGGLAWITFLGLFLYTGIRLLLTASDSDRVWYFVGVSSFVSAAYIWGMSIIYVPGAVMLMLGALCTGITLTAYRVLGSRPSREFSVMANRRIGYLFTLAVIAVIVGSVSVLYSSGRHYAAAFTFNTSLRELQQGASPDAVEAKLLNAYELSPSDVYARSIAEAQLARMNMLLSVTEPTQVEQDKFNSAVAMGVQSATDATKTDSTESANWAILGAIYNALVSVNVEGVYERALEALTKARDLNPKNPFPYLQLAMLEGKVGKFDEARRAVESAIALKPNYTDAFFYLSQIDIVTGNVEGAIRSTQAIIALEPQNPARYYQLGVLYTSQRNIDGAIVAFERAVALDENYANARYLLALAYDAKGRSQDAEVQLEKVLELNPGNEEVTQLIDILKKQGSLQITASSTEQSTVVSEETNVTEENGTVTTSEAPDSPLVTPVNTAPAPTSEGEESTSAPEASSGQ